MFFLRLLRVRLTAIVRSRFGGQVVRTDARKNEVRMKNRRLWSLSIAVVGALALLVGCGGNSSPKILTPPPHTSSFTWVSGANSKNGAGVYGTQGTTSASNVPGARQFPSSWTDSGGNLWLFGGNGLDSTGTGAYLNDLWKFDGTNWTWVAGSNVATQAGVYGVQGTAAPGNSPGGRPGAATWTDSSGNLWLFGGYGLDSSSMVGELNDLWKFDGTNWTWVSGSNTFNTTGNYGAEGVADPGNVPGARDSSVSWVDSGGNLWLFGGSGFDSVGTSGLLNDLWKFDGTNWTWVGGSNVAKQAGTYGTKGTAASSNVPGARAGAVAWRDSGGNFWLFGGSGVDSVGTSNILNDLWKFDGSSWTWMGGSNVVDQSGVYGTKGTAASSNLPGARFYAVSWTDKNGKFWLFGGGGLDSTGANGSLNDLWQFDGANWTWVGGSELADQSGAYGTKGTGSESNFPGGRLGFVSWTDKNGNLVLFGGAGLDASGSFGFLNDLWRLAP